jgi:hypothetical protein
MNSVINLSTNQHYETQINTKNQKLVGWWFQIDEIEDEIEEMKRKSCRLAVVRWLSAQSVVSPRAGDGRRARDGGGAPCGHATGSWPPGGGDRGAGRAPCAAVSLVAAGGGDGGAGRAPGSGHCATATKAGRRRCVAAMSGRGHASAGAGWLDEWSGAGGGRALQRGRGVWGWAELGFVCLLLGLLLGWVVGRFSVNRTEETGYFGSREPGTE